MKASARSISTDGTTDRRKHLRDALGNAALEGIKPRPEAMADLQKMVGGTLSPEECRQRVKARYGIQG
jgi:Antitoxin VbhA